MISTIIPDTIEIIHDTVVGSYNNQLCFCKRCTGSSGLSDTLLHTKEIEIDVEENNRKLKINIIITLNEQR